VDTFVGNLVDQLLHILPPPTLYSIVEYRNRSLTYSLFCTLIQALEYFF